MCIYSMHAARRWHSYALVSLFSLDRMQGDDICDDFYSTLLHRVFALLYGIFPSSPLAATYRIILSSGGVQTRKKSKNV